MGLVTTASTIGVVATQAIGTAKLVATAVKEYDKIELKLQAVELVNQVQELAMENMELRQQVQTLNDRLKLRAELYSQGNRYFRNKPEGTPDGPFCTRCFDVDGLLVLMHLTERMSGPDSYECPNCIILRSPKTKSGF